MIDQKVLINNASQLRPLPASVHRLADLAAQPDPDLAEIVDVVTYDPVLSAKLLKTANSVMYARGTPASTVKGAAIRLGTGMVLGLAMGANARPLVTATVPGYDISGDDFWRHAVLAGLVAEVGCSCTQRPWSPAGFTAALLHDFGKLILGKYLSGEVHELLRRAITEGGQEPFQAEYEVLAVHHAEVGALIAQHWQLPENIVQGILHHHDPEEGRDPLCHVTYLANRIAKRIADGEDKPDADEARLSSTLDRLGIAPSSLEKLCSQVVARFAALKEQYD